MDREQRLDEIITAFVKAQEAGVRPDPAEWLARHPEWNAELTEFFSAQRQIDQAAVPLRDSSTLATGQPAAPLGHDRYLGDYELLEEIARGGMGVVYKARQVSLNRPVALKMILAGQSSTAADEARFRTEAEAAANLDHPNILPVYEVGEHSGQQYFSMKLIEGGSLAADSFAGNDRRLAGLMETVARAVHFAHQRGILHRDLKPANILLDADGRPYVTDFGLAKRFAVDAGVTQSGAIVGTPGYMAPEQARAEKGLTVAADVYALGAILYELLTGRPPFRAATPLDTVLQVIEKEPEPPRRLRPDVPVDLETICLKCLQKDPGQRYASALDLAEDLRCFRSGEPIAARPVGRLERAWRWCRRNPAVAALTAAVLLTLVLGAVVSAVLAILANANAEEAKGWAEEARGQALAAGASADKARAEKDEADRQRQLAKDNEAEARKQLDQARGNLFTTQLARVEAVWDRDPAQALELLHDYNACPIDLRDFAWHLYDRACRRDRMTLPDRAGEVRCVAFSADGRTLVVARDSGVVESWDPQTGKQLATFKGDAFPRTITGDAATITAVKTDSGLANVANLVLWDVKAGRRRPALAGQLSRKGNEAFGQVAFSGDGQTIAAAVSSPTVVNDNRIRLWDVTTGRLRTSLPGHQDNTVTALALSGDGQLLASAAETFDAQRRVLPGEIKLWDVKTGRLHSILKGHKSHFITSLRFALDGQTLASTAMYEDVVKLWDVNSGKDRGSLNTGTGLLTFSPDGQWLATAQGGTVNHPGGYVIVWDVKTGRELTSFKGHTSSVTAMAFRPDGRTLVSGSKDWKVKLWNVQASFLLASLKTSDYTALAFSSGGRPRFLSKRGDTTIKLRDVETGEKLPSLEGHTGYFGAVALSRDGNTLASAEANGVIQFWDVKSRQCRATLKGHVFGGIAMAFNDDGQTFTSAGSDGTVKLWNVATGREWGSFKLARFEQAALAFSPDGQALALAEQGGSIALWDVKAKRQYASAVTHFRVSHLIFDRQGRVLASVGTPFQQGRGSTIKFWDVRTGKELALLKDATYPAAFSPDGQTLASGSDGATIKLWDVRTGKELAALQGHTLGQAGMAAVNALAFNFNGRTLASAGEDGTVRLWDVRTGQQRASLRENRVGVGSVWKVAFSPDGRILVSVGGSGTLFWDARPTRELAYFKAHRYRITSIAFSPEGQALVSAGEDATIKIWDAKTGRRRALLDGNGSTVAAVAISPDGQMLASGSSMSPGPFRSVGEIKMWDAKTGGELWSARTGRESNSRFRPAMSSVFAVAFSPGGTTLASSSPDEITLWDARAGRAIAALPAQAGGSDSLVFSGDGQTLASAGKLFRAIKLWDVKAGRERAILSGHAGGVHALALKGDGQTLASTGGDHF
jgi:WD40 repeat protein/tRNA A-37 threonylcarbamoyl transferase component Bud32